MRTRTAICSASLAASLLLACTKGPAAPQPPAEPAAPSAAGSDRAQAARTDADVERFVVKLGDAPTLGPATAAVTVVMFSDFECPFCVQGLETLKRLRDLYPDDVRIAYKALPLDNHANALLAAMAARSAQGQGKFWEFHDLLFSGQRLDPGVILSYAKHVGLDMNALVRDLDTLEYGPEVRRDARQARRLGVSSTPTFFINGRVISGAKPLAEFDRIIGEELRYADDLRSAGVPDQQLYDETLRGGFEEVQYAKGRRGLDPDGVYVVPLGDSPRKGPDDAPITIVSFGDFACPFCAKGNATMERIEAHYGDKIRVVHKHKPLPFHRHADPAARAGVAAQSQGKFWEFHDALYAFGPKFGSEDLRTIAREIGLDMAVFEKEMSSQSAADRVEADLALSMALGVNGTPGYFINGRPLEGAYPEIHIRLLIEEELERVAAARTQGIAPGELYEHLTHTPLVD
ncbi:MAG: DsbA family protein [Nannocystales bacterium]